MTGVGHVDIMPKVHTIVNSFELRTYHPKQRDMGHEPQQSVREGERVRESVCMREREQGRGGWFRG